VAPSLSVPELVDRWVAAGIITGEQAQRINADLATVPAVAVPAVPAPAGPAVSRSGASLVAEALGYLGGVIVLVGVGLVLGLTWLNLTAEVRVGLAGAVAVAFGVAGWLIPVGRLGASGARLRGVLWLVTSVAVFACIALAGDQLMHLHDARIALQAGVGAAVVSAVLWWLHRHVLQQLAVVASLLVTAAAAAGMASDDFMAPSLAVWGVGVIWYLLSLPGIVPPRGGGVLGALSAVGGGISMLGDSWGPLLALGTVVALVVAGVLRRELGVLGVASIGTLIVLPITTDHYFPGALPAALALVLGGLALVAVAVYTARRRPAPRT